MTQLLGALIAGLLFIVAPATHAAPITYSFTGTVYAGAAELLGQTVSGTFSYDVDLTTTTSTCCDIGTVAQAQSAQTLPGLPPYASAFVALSGGNTYRAGNGTLSNYGRSEVIKEAGEEGSPGPMNSFEVEALSTDLDTSSRSIALRTGDFLGASSAIFPDAGAGLANDQAVNWLAPGANSYGSVLLQSGGFGQVVAQFTLASISLVPEPPAPMLLLAGMLLLGTARHALRNGA